MIRKNILGKLTSSTKASQKSLSQGQLKEIIQRRAYELYEKRGRSPCNELADWFEAESQVKKEFQPDLLQKKGTRKKRNAE